MLSSSINQQLWAQYTRRQKLLHLLKTLTTLLLFLTIILFLGAFLESYFVTQASSTSWAYKTDQVCAHLGQRSIGRFKTAGESMVTYKNYEAAKEDGASVVHCGECGWCSNEKDVLIIQRTKETLTKTTTECAKLSIPFRRGVVEKCMNVGFTKECRDCWVDNIFCTLARCGFTCMKSVLLYKQSNNPNNKSPRLNPCLECDEKLCGPNFIRCAGANRRRSGIVSDITRDGEEEICGRVDEDWREWLDVLHSMHEGHFEKYAKRRGGGVKEGEL